MHLGFLVNPIAGIGGTVGLQGSDGLVDSAREIGGVPRAPARAERFIRACTSALRQSKVTTVAGPMGSAYLPADVDASVCVRPTYPSEAGDTAAAVAEFVDADVDLIVFVGGDGTAVDVADALDGTDLPILGVPAGVKIYSGIFAATPEAAATVVGSGFETVEAEILDRPDHRVSSPAPVELQATVQTPVARAVQGSKRTVTGSVDGLIDALATEVAASDALTILGPGGTLGRLKEALAIEGTPLGVDVVRGDDLVAADADATTLESLVSASAPRLIISPIGGQGFIFGRGNLQLTPPVISAADLTVIASPQKLQTIPFLRVDTDDPELDASLRGWMRVRTGRVTHELLAVH